MQTITPFLWFNGNVEEAVRFYASVFPNTRIENANPAQATFELLGQKFMALNGGPAFKFNEAVSFFLSCDTQDEVDTYWRKLLADGGSESQCGWLKDKFGLSWQVIPRQLGRYLSDPDRTKAKRVMDAMLTMKKIDVAALDRAYAG
jgi:predicted 3-demethylubiquinone-9 3-methyltransferase (glyoxalase superfamily)